MTIFHLEDEHMLRDVTLLAFETMFPDVSVVQFADSDEALKYIQEHGQEIKAYILDIRVIGSMTGIELAQKIREAGLHTPIMITSAYTRPPAEVMEELQLEWMSKPTDLYRLQKWLGEQISK